MASHESRGRVPTESSPARPGAEPVAVFRDVRFTYRGAARPALDGVNLNFRRGEFAVVLGASGAGKSTLCFCMNGLIPHFLRGQLEGDVEVLGTSTRGRAVAQMAERVGLVFQDFEAQLFSTNVELEVAFGPENFAVPPDEIRRRVAEALATVGLAGFEHREPATLSGGQKQRLAIASVLSLQPPLLVMDEPTTDLDPLGKQQVFSVADRLRSRGDVTLVIAEHEVEEAARADRVIILERGRVAADGPPGEVLTRPDELERLGVQPLGGTQLLARLGLEPVLGEDECAEALRRAGWEVDAQAYARLVERDAARSQRYGEPVVEIRDLRHRYANGVVALDGVDLTIRSGEFVAVVGQNGSGKTTLVKHINGLLRPGEGEVRLAGQDVSGRSVLELGRIAGYVFQNPDHQIFAETVFDEVAFGPRNHGVDGPELEERVREALAAVGLEGREQEDPFALTKGERQRVAVASILATRPRVLILDEPTTGLDYREQRQMMDLVRKLVDAGHTVICVTHTMWVVAEYAHRTVVMRDGRVWLDGPTREVMAREAELLEAHLRPPHLVRVCNRLGHTLLSLDECLEVLRRRGGEVDGR